MNKFNSMLFSILFLSGSVFSSDFVSFPPITTGHICKFLNNLFSISFLSGSVSSFDFISLPPETTGHICKFLNHQELGTFSQTCKLIQDIAKSDNAHDCNTSVKIDNEWHRYFSTIVYEIKGVLFPFVIIPGETYMMGEGNRQREVTIKSPLLVQMTPVTQEQYKAITGQNPSDFKPADGWEKLPVECVSYDDIVGDSGFIKIVEDSGFKGFRLPTEEEWEYFARAGSTTKYFWGDEESGASDYAWYHGNSDDKTHPVATKRANPWRIYDTSGNVWEWTCSLWDDRNTAHVTCGGSYSFSPLKLRSSVRYCMEPGIHDHEQGFRLVRTLNL